VTAASPTGSQTQPVDHIDLTFSEDIADGSFTVDDIVSLVGPAGAITPTAVTRLSSTQYRVSFASQSGAGNYTLVVGPNISDAAGNLMDQDQDGTNGESADDRFTTTFSIAAPTPPPPSTNPPSSSSYQFDFGTSSSPLATGYTRVTAGTAFSTSTGYGWTSGNLAERDRGTGSSTNRDFVFSSDATFAVNLPNGTYNVTLTMGDTGPYWHDQMGVYLEGNLADTVSTSLGQAVTNTYSVTVKDGQLTLRLRDLGGTDPNVVINALTITSTQSVQSQSLASGAAATPASVGTVSSPDLIGAVLESWFSNSDDQEEGVA
jgi:hypothetical protein